MTGMLKHGTYVICFMFISDCERHIVQKKLALTPFTVDISVICRSRILPLISYVLNADSGR